MENELQIIFYDQSIELTYYDYEASGFSSGFTLFQAVRKAFLEYYEMDYDNFQELINEVLETATDLPKDVLSDFKMTSELFLEGLRNRSTIVEWDYSSFFTYWTEFIDIVKTNDKVDLIYCVGKGDYEIDNFGWEECESYLKDFTEAEIPSAEKYLKKPSLIDDVALINFGVWDETGKFILLKCENVDLKKSLKFLNLLRSRDIEEMMSIETYTKAEEYLINFFNNTK